MLEKELKKRGRKKVLDKSIQVVLSVKESIVNKFGGYDPFREMIYKKFKI